MKKSKKILNQSNSYQYYKTNYNSLKDEVHDLNKDVRKLKNKVRILENVADSHLELFNLIFIESNFKMRGQYRLLQLQTLELLKFLVKLCEKYGYTYWLDYGTLIGALRHEGFVPWDDEIDMSMPREDYEEFIKILPDEMAKYPQLEGNIELRMGVGPLRHVKYSGVPSPCAQFVQLMPLANVDIHPVDYFKASPDNENELLVEYTKEKFIELRDGLRDKIQSGEYTDFTEASLIEGEKLGVSFEKTNLIGACMDGTIRYPLLTSEVFPLKKHEFEGFEFNIPKNPIKYLDSHYVSDVMKMPKYMVSHSRLEMIRERVKEDEDLNELFEKVLSEWKEINSDF